MIFEGIVEDDNVAYGYVKVRIFGKHNHDKTILPTTDLPNAKIVYSGESNIDEISYFRTICNGSWVIVSFLDKEEQKPVVLGSVVKNVDKLPDFSKGFTDKNNEHPSKIGSTISSEAKTNYPNKRVLKTKKHVIEIDDTDGNELIKVKHNSGSEVEIDNSGDVTINSTGNIIIESGNTTLTGGEVTIAGTVSPTGSGALCGLPNCLFTGAPQTGETTSGA